MELIQNNFSITEHQTSANSSTLSGFNDASTLGANLNLLSSNNFVQISETNSKGIFYFTIFFKIC